MKKSLLLLPILVIGASAYGMKEGMKEGAELTAFKPKGARWNDLNPQAMRTLEEIMFNSDEMPLFGDDNKDLRLGFSKLASALNGGVQVDGEGARLSPVLAGYLGRQARAGQQLAEVNEFYLQAKKRHYIRLAVELGVLSLVGFSAYQWGKSSK